MSLDAVTKQTVTLTGTCDDCGTVRTWEQADKPDAEPDDVQLGFVMTDPTPGRFARSRLLWFHDAACVHRYVEANVVEALRHPENVRVPA